jgi:hypothetical protein
MRTNFYQILGHAINDCMGVVSNNEELKKEYAQDVKEMPSVVRMTFAQDCKNNDDSRALGCSEIIGILVGGDGHHGIFPMMRSFPRSTEYLRKKLSD